MKRPHRSTIPVAQTWDLEGLYPTHDAWEADYTRLKGQLPGLAAYRGRLGQGPAALLACLDLRTQLSEVANRVYWFAFNRVSEDQSDPERQGLLSRAQALAAELSAAAAFVEPEILALPDGTVETFVESEPALRLYRHYLYDLLDRKPHTLTAEAESVLASLGELLQAPYTTFNNAVNADAAFDPITDEQGNQVPVSLANYAGFLQSANRDVRQAAYLSVGRGLRKFKRTLASTHAAAQRRDAILARLRNYPSSLAAALAPHHLPESLFHTLLDVTDRGSHHFRRAQDYRRRRLGLDKLQPWDRLAPLESDIDADLSFDQAYAILLEALAPLGAEYRAVLEQARRERWVDWADNDGKQAGAYSAGCYGYHPVILQTWKNKYLDLFTLAHELGHAVHSVRSSAAQPFIYHRYSSFLAEMASTTNEVLLARHLLATRQEPAFRRYVIQQTLRSFDGNFWNGSAVAKFQLQIHQMAEAGTPLTYERVSEVHAAIQRERYGDLMEVGLEGMGDAWLGVLHHYRNFYYFQYATGIAAGAAFADAILTEGEPAVERYLRFLSRGSSAHDIDILLEAGLDFRTPAPIERAVALYASLVDELEVSEK